MPVPVLVAAAWLAAVPAPVRAQDAAAKARRDSGWVPLFNGKDFDGLYTVIRDAAGQRRNDAYPANGGLFEVTPEGEVQAHIGMGFLATRSRFSHYRVRVEYRFGTRGNDPFNGNKATFNAGFLYHVSDDAIWPRGLECQLLRGDAGTIWFNPDQTLRTTVDPATRGEEHPRYLSREQGGVEVLQPGASRRSIRKSARYDLEGQWNTAEVLVKGDSSRHYVNGMLNNGGWDIRVRDAKTGQMVLVTSGSIGLQAEWTEIRYRNFEILDLAKPTTVFAKPIREVGAVRGPFREIPLYRDSRGRALQSGRHSGPRLGQAR